MRGTMNASKSWHVALAGVEMLLDERAQYTAFDKYFVVVVKVKLSRMDAPELTISCANVVNG